MADVNGRCGSLCQHPGCWYAEIKPRPPHHKLPEDYSHYLAELTARRKSRSELDDTRMHSHTVDGLPTLKIQTLNQDSLGNDRLSTSLPTPTRTHLQRRCGHKRPGGNLEGIRQVNYTQISLEDDEYYPVDDMDGITFKPVLIWRPRVGHRKPHTSSSPRSSPGIKKKMDKPPEQVSSHTSVEGVDSSTVPRSEKERPSSSHRQAKPGKQESVKNSISPRKTNLTNNLPPCRTPPARELRPPGSRFPKPAPITPDSLSLSYLGDIDLPPQVVEEIMQQLRSGSTSNTNIMEPRCSTKLSSQSRTSHTPLPPPSTTPQGDPSLLVSTRIPASISYDLNSKKIINLSASKLGHSPLTAGSSSFSRKLSTHPLEVLKESSAAQRTKPSQGGKEKMKSVPRCADIPTAATGGYLLPTLSHNKCEIGEAQVTGQTSCLHTRSSLQPKATCSYQQPLPPGGAKRDNLSGIRIPVAYHSALRPSARRVTLELNSDPKLYASASQRSRDVKPSPRFVQVPKSRYSAAGQRAPPPSSSSFRPDMGGDVPLVAHGCLEWRSPAPNGNKTASVLPVGFGFQHLVSESPDFMLVDAKFAKGHLILTNQEGVVIRQLAESESEANLDFHSLSLEHGRPISMSAGDLSPLLDLEDREAGHLSGDKEEGLFSKRGSVGGVKAQEGVVTSQEGGGNSDEGTGTSHENEGVVTPQEGRVEAQEQKGSADVEANSPVAVGVAMDTEGGATVQVGDDNGETVRGIRAPPPSAA